jgi:transcription elongation factor Elf1
MRMQFLQSTHQCPECSSNNVRRARRHGVLEHMLMKMIRVHPYRCENCEARFYNAVTPHAQRPDRYSLSR